MTGSRGMGTVGMGESFPGEKRFFCRDVHNYKVSGCDHP